jgi:hypothetical protein
MCILAMGTDFKGFLQQKQSCKLLKMLPLRAELLCMKSTEKNVKIFIHVAMCDFLMYRFVTLIHSSFILVNKLLSKYIFVSAVSIFRIVSYSCPIKHYVYRSSLLKSLGFGNTLYFRIQVKRLRKKIYSVGPHIPTV